MTHHPSVLRISHSTSSSASCTVRSRRSELALYSSSRLGAFFTPMELANDFKIEVHGRKILDLCAGIGILSFCCRHFRHHEQMPDITSIEINPEYVRIGRKLLPEATWICADVFDVW